MIDDEYHVAIVTPSIHYCMGGLEITTKGEVIGQSDKPIPGFYAAGEIAGGVHGNNRLGGSSLLDCVAYGRVAGRNCAAWMFGEDGKSSGSGSEDNEEVCYVDKVATHKKFLELKRDYMKFKNKSKNEYDFFNIVERSILGMEDDETPAAQLAA